MSIGVVIPTWGRPHIADRVLSYWDGMRSADICVSVVLSPEDPDPPAVPSAFRVTYARNDNMALKWGAGLMALRGRVSCAMVMGSDDIATPGYVLEAASAALMHGASRPGSIWFASEDRDEAFEARYRNIYAGACYSGAFLDSIGWRLFGNGSEHPDMATAWNMQGVDWHKLPTCTEMGEALVDIKGPGNVWDYDHVLTKCENRRTILSRTTARELLSKFDGFY